MLVAIGDIHGNYKELIELLSVLKNETDFDSDTFIFLGDYVDGGPDSAKVVETLRMFERKYPHWVFLKGNHEDMMLDALVHNSVTYGDWYQWFNQGGEATFESYAQMAYPDATDYEIAIMQPLDVIPPADLIWLEERPLYHETEKHLFVHAGLLPNNVPVSEQEKQDLLWVRSMFYNSDYDWGKRVIFGHSWDINPRLAANKIGIDTLSRYKRNGRVRDVGHLGAVILNDETQRRHEFVCVDRVVRAQWNALRVPD